MISEQDLVLGVHMKITSVQALVSAPPETFVFAKVTTSDGLVGYGEAEADGAPMVRSSYIDRLGQSIIGMDPMNTDMIYQYLNRCWFFACPAQDLMRCIGAIDEALLDIKGKALGTPVYNLLGGKFRDSIKLYCHIWIPREESEQVKKVTPEMQAEGAVRQVKQGFDVVKFDPFTTVFNQEVGESAKGFVNIFQGMNYPRKLVPKAIDMVRAVREAVGPEIGICLDFHGRLDVESAIRIGRLLEPFDLYFYEEPIPPGDDEELAYVRSRVNIPICCGERNYTLRDFRRLFELQGTDIIMPDHARNGGITQIKEVAKLADTFRIPVAPHVVPTSPLNAVIGAHNMASIPNFLIHESMGPQRLRLYADLLKPQILPENGYLRVPDRPGLGVELVEENLAKERTQE
jgi:galactonate dehydratase